MIPKKRELCCSFMLLVIGFSNCSRDSSPEGVADAFLFRYFVELNQRGALEITTGLAAKKLQKEIELTQSVRMTPDLDLAKHKPFLDYELVKSQRREDDSVTFFYEVTIENPDGEDGKREVVVSTAQFDGAWRVTNFDTFLK